MAYLINRTLLLLLLLSASASILVPHASNWFLSSPLQGPEYSGYVSYLPNPPVAGQPEQWIITFRNVGSIALTVTNFEIQTDWVNSYYATDVPQIVNPGSNYQFAPIQMPIPTTATGPHSFEMWVWVEVPTSSGSWSTESREPFVSMTLNIQAALSTTTSSEIYITGPTTVTFPTQEFTCDAVNCYIVVQGVTQATFTSWEASMNQGTGAGINWGSLFLPLAIVLFLVLIAIVGWLIHLQKRANSKQKM